MRCSIRSYFCSRRSPKAEPLTAGILAGLIAIVAGVVYRRRCRCADEGDLPNKEGSVPHTDFDAAASIGRTTGGEVFDD